MRGIPFLVQRPILRFFLLTALSFVLMTAGWRFVADYASRPAAFISRVMLEMNFSSTWLDSTTQGPHQLVVNTRVVVPFTPQQLAEQERKAEEHRRAREADAARRRTDAIAQTVQNPP